MSQLEITLKIRYTPSKSDAMARAWEENTNGLLYVVRSDLNRMHMSFLGASLANLDWMGGREPAAVLRWIHDGQWPLLSTLQEAVLRANRNTYIREQSSVLLVNLRVRWNGSDSLPAGTAAAPLRFAGTPSALPAPASPPTVLPPIYFSRHAAPGADLRAFESYRTRSPDERRASQRRDPRARSRSRGASRSPPRPPRAADASDADADDDSHHRRAATSARAMDSEANAAELRARVADLEARETGLLARVAAAEARAEAAEAALADMKQEARDPFVVPALVDAMRLLVVDAPRAWQA